MDIGTIEKYMQAHSDILNGKCDIVECRCMGSEIHVGNNVFIHPDCRIIGPVYIGDNVSIAEKTHISNSVIGNNVSVGSASTIAGSIIWDGINISSKENILNSVVTENSVVSKNTFALPAVNLNLPGNLQVDLKVKNRIGVAN
jgi:mannose-1-phosphate guanylyltransferase